MAERDCRTIAQGHLALPLWDSVPSSLARRASPVSPPANGAPGAPGSFRRAEHGVAEGEPGRLASAASEGRAAPHRVRLNPSSATLGTRIVLGDLERSAETAVGTASGGRREDRTHREARRLARACARRRDLRLFPAEDRGVEDDGDRDADE